MVIYGTIYFIQENHAVLESSVIYTAKLLCAADIAINPKGKVIKNRYGKIEMDGWEVDWQSSPHNPANY